LRAEGAIRFFGVSINDHDPANSLRLIESGAADTVQVIYNVFDQSPEDELFPACREHDIGVIARVPFDEGGLTGALKPDSEFAEDEVAETALLYILSEPTVSTVIPGIRSQRNVQRNIAVSDGHGLDHLQREKLHEHRWVRNVYR
jgi:aryl-alcohol dehydrogenase-like predicted oxidoreductase